MARAQSRRHARIKRHRRLRNKVEGTAARPRLCVFRSADHIYAQLIDDQAGCTLAAAGTVEKDLREACGGQKPLDQARAVGEVLAQRAQEKGLSQAVFDRGGYRFHGRVKALAEGSRAKGLRF